MAAVNFGVVRIDGRWTVIGPALRTRSFETQEQAERVARRFADEVIGRPVYLHLQAQDGELRRSEPASFA